MNSSVGTFKGIYLRYGASSATDSFSFMIPRKALINSLMLFMKSFDFSRNEVLKLFLIVATLILTLARILTPNRIGFNV